MQNKSYFRKLMINPLTGGLFQTTIHRNPPIEQTSNELNHLYYPIPSKLSTEERYQKIISIGAECQKPEEVRHLVEANRFIYCYDGFEPSGRMHIAQGILKTINVNKLVDAGCIFVFWVADWFAMLNNKMGGDLNKIRVVGEYFIEIWKAMGMKMNNVKFLWASDFINNNSAAYWMKVMNIGCQYSLDRIKRCSTIMGREESDNLKLSQMIYPLMQCADIFELDVDICQLGLDQKKVNMLAREFAADTHRHKTPVILSQGMLSGLQQGEKKMSKSTGSAIFMEDSEAEVQKKIKSAFCEEGNIEENPCLEYVENLLLGYLGRLEVLRKEEYGGNIVYTEYENIKSDFKNKKLHPNDLKKALSEGINKILEPVRKNFKENPRAAKLLQLVKEYRK